MLLASRARNRIQPWWMKERARYGNFLMYYPSIRPAIFMETQGPQGELGILKSDTLFKLKQEGKIFILMQIRSFVTCWHCLQLKLGLFKGMYMGMNMKIFMRNSRKNPVIVCCCHNCPARSGKKNEEDGIHTKQKESCPRSMPVRQLFFFFF